MRWYEANVYALKEVGRDVVGTAVCEPELTGTVLVRPTPWGTTPEDGNEGNAYDYVRRTFLTRAPHEAFAGSVYIETMGERYTVKKMAYSLGMSMIVAERCKVRP